MPDAGIAVGAVTGSLRERACFSPVVNRIDIRCSGARPDRARRLAAELVDGGCGALLSVGLAGGLDPALRAGDLVLSSTVISPDGAKVPTDDAWRDRFAAALESARMDFRIGAVLGADELVRFAGSKHTLHSATGALAADMESHEVMRVAAALKIPFLAIRVIADAAEDELPETAARSLTSEGGVALISILAGLIRRPSDISGMAMLARRSTPAFATLRRVAALPFLREPL